MKAFRLMLMISGVFGVAVSEAAPLPELAPLKAWRRPAAGQEKSFEPVLKDDQILFGSKILKLTKDGKLICNTPGNPVFSASTYFHVVDAEKKDPVWDWKTRNFDPDKSRFYRDGRKYIWEIWYKSAKTPAFLGVYQTLEVLPDGRLSIAWRFNLPAERDGVKFVPWTWSVSMPESSWSGNTADLGGKQLKLTQELKFFTVSAKAAPTEWWFGIGDPEKKFSVQFRKGEVRDVYIHYRKAAKDFQMVLNRLAKTGAVNQLVMDLRKGTVSQGKDIRAGVDFKAQENMQLPDNSHRNLVENGSFERGYEGWHKRGLHFSNVNGLWDWRPYHLDEHTAYDGKVSLCFETHPSSPTWLHEIPQLAPTEIAADPGFYTLSFYAKCESGKKPDLHVWIPNYPNGPAILAMNKDTARWKFRVTDHWKRYQVTFELKPGSPLLYLSFLARDPAGKSRVWLDAVQLEKGKKVSVYQAPPAEGRLLTSDPENFISSKAKINGLLRITTAKPNLSGKVRVTVKNFFSEQLLDITREFRSGADRTAEVALPLDDLPGLGVFVVKAEYELADGSRAYDFKRYARIEFQDGPRPNKHFFGLDYFKTSGKWDFLLVLDRWRKLGVGAKHHVSSRRKEVFEAYRKFDVEPSVNTSLTYRRGGASGPHIEHFFIVDAGEPPWTVSPDDPRVLVRDFHLDAGGKITPEYLAKVERAAETLGKHYPDVPLWALAGELTCKMPYEWWGKGAEYQDVIRQIARLMKAFADGIRKGNPNAKVFQDDPASMGPRTGIAETDLLLAECNKLGLKFDLIAIHPYRNSPENPDLDADTRTFLDMLESRGYGKVPVLWPEGMSWGPYNVPQWGGRRSGSRVAPWCNHGMISYDMGWTEKLSAAFHARAFLVGLKYSDRIVGVTSGATFNNCYMDTMMTPFAAQLIPNTLCSIFGKFKFRKDIRFAPSVRTYIFEDEDKRPIAAVWCHNEDVDAGLADAPTAEADFGDSLEAVIDLMNSPRAFKRGRMQFPVTPFPLFFRGKPGTLDRMVKAFSGAELLSGKALPQLAVSANPSGSTAVRITVQNFISREFRGILNGRELKVPAAGKTELQMPMKTPLRADRIVPVDQTVKIKSEKGREVRYDFSFTAFLAKRVPADATVDTLDWNRLPAIPLELYTGKKSPTKGFFRIGWNHLGLFLETVVRDPVFLHMEHKDVYSWYLNDCLQIYIDTMANARSRQFKGYDEDDYDYALIPNSRGDAARIYRFRTVNTQLGLATQAPPDYTFADDIPARFSNRDGVLTYRVFFPAKYLLPMKLEKGWVFGFGLFAANSNERGKVDGGLSLASDGKGCWMRPHTWPAVVLSDDDEIK